jgi:hypothetical protein
VNISETTAKIHHQLSLRIQAGISHFRPGKKLPPGDRDWPAKTASFYTEHHTLDSFIHAVAVRGYSFSPVMKNGYRKAANFMSGQVLATDDDRGVPGLSDLETLSKDPFTASHAAFLYSTPSSTPEHPKSRTVFALDRPITDAAQYRLVSRVLARKYRGTDQSVAEEGRFFYGTVNGDFINLGNVLTSDVLEHDLVAPYLEDLRREAQQRTSPQLPNPGLVRGDSKWEKYINRAIDDEVAWVSTRQEGTGERHRGLLIAAIKLQSLKLSDWLPEDIRRGIDPVVLLLPAAAANGYIPKYGEDVARKTISDGMSYASARPFPAQVTASPKSWGRRRIHRSIEVRVR